MSKAQGIAQSANQGQFKNRIINGNMAIDQRNAGASVTANNAAFPVDRFRMDCTQTSKGTIQQTPSATETGYATRIAAGFTNYVAFTSSSAYSVLSTDEFTFTQNIEGQNISDLAWGTANAKTVTLSFWVYSSLTGTFGGSFENSAANRSYPFSYTISAANTWEQKTITVTGDTSGTWLTTNGIGLRIFWSLGTGSNYNGTAGAWAAGDYRSVSGATSVVGTNGATFYITGVQLEKGSVATSFDYRPYGTELALCQRYAFVYATSANGDMFCTGYNNSTTQAVGILPLPVTMRTTPSVTFNQSASSYGSYLVPFNTVAASAVATLNNTTQTSVGLSFTISGAVAGQGTILKNAGSGTANITMSAEL